MTTPVHSLTSERLRHLLHYDPQTGVFTWRVNRRLGRTGKGLAGTAAGSLQHGYRSIKVDAKTYKAHRLAWLYVTGQWPSGEIDHMNGRKDDNRWCNLRDVSGPVNVQNQRRPHAGNRSGYLGVSLNRGRWVAAIQVDKCQKILGRFLTPEAASEAYLSAKRRLHEGCTI